MADKLLTGHLNKIIETAVRAGMPMEKAIYCATWTPSRRMHLDDRGMIAPGKIADFLLLDSLDGIVPKVPIFMTLTSAHFASGSSAFKTKSEISAGRQLIVW